MAFLVYLWGFKFMKRRYIRTKPYPTGIKHWFFGKYHHQESKEKIGIKRKNFIENGGHGKRICLKCAQEYIAIAARQKYCGSISKKSGCSYLIAKQYNPEYDKKRRNMVVLCKKCKGIKVKVKNENGFIRRKCFNCYVVKPIRKLKTRFILLQKFNFTCQYCGRTAPHAELQIDHIFPRSKGGITVLENLVVACKECNLGKRDFLLEKVPQALGLSSNSL